MYIKIRLYKKYDLDLCKLYISRPRYFTKQLGDAVRAYYRGKPFQADFQSIGIKEPPNVIEIKLLLDEKQDIDIITALKSVIPKQRNSFVKKLFRHYLTFDTLQLFMLNAPNLAFSSVSTTTANKNAPNVLKAENKPISKLSEASDETTKTNNNIKEVEPVEESHITDDDLFMGFDDMDIDISQSLSDEIDEDAYQTEVGDIFAGLL